MKAKMNAHQLAVKSWELLPEYGNARSMRDALSQKRGSCLHRSIVIGREATKAGIVAHRSIKFGSNMVPAVFSNYVLIDGVFMQIATGQILGGYRTEEQYDLFEPDEVYVGTTAGGIGILDYNRPPKTAGIVIVPELQMKFYSGCFTLREYLRQACVLRESRASNVSAGEEFPVV